MPGSAGRKKDRDTGKKPKRSWGLRGFPIKIANDVSIRKNK
jgi:hypothetical protein